MSRQGACAKRPVSVSFFSSLRPINGQGLWPQREKRNPLRGQRLAIFHFSFYFLIQELIANQPLRGNKLLFLD